MKPAFLVPGTLCDGRVFGDLVDRLGIPIIADYSAFSSVRDAAVALLPTVPRGSLGISFSLGGWILLELLRLDPDRFEAVVLISGNAHPDGPENAVNRRARVARARADGFQAVFAEEWDGALGPLHRDDPVIQAAIVDMADTAGHDSHARQAEINISRPDFRGFVSNPPCSIHVIAGAQDGLCPQDRYESAAAGPRSRLKVIEGAGHYVALENKAALAAYVQAHFQEYLK
ncbi:MAG: alpha/beta hydrolase [Pseudomonadota bacterium]